MTPEEQDLFSRLKEQEVTLPEATWEQCRLWLRKRDWNINVLADYPRGEVKFSVRRGFERIEVSGQSDLEVMARAILEIAHRDRIHSAS